MDSYIKRELKNWSDNQHPPTNGKARLLLVAAVDCGPIDTDQPMLSIKERSSALASDLRVGQQFEPVNHAWLWVMHLGLHPLRHFA